MHFHLPKPLHGWRAFAGEVGIIVVGVLIAIGAEQVVGNIRWHWEADSATDSLQVEMSDHYFAASEALITQPCIDRQLRLLEANLNRPESFVTAVLYSDDSSDYTFRAPDRIWSDSVWHSVVSEGVASHLTSEKRLMLGGYYSQVLLARENNEAFNILAYRLRVLAQPLSLDVGTRTKLLEELEEARGRAREGALISYQLLRKAEFLHLLPDKKTFDAQLANSGTIKFCRNHRLPLGSNKA